MTQPKPLPSPPSLALTIAGSDPSGGAGLQADLSVFARHGLRGAGVPSALTVQSGAGVRSVHPVEPTLVDSQLRAVLEDHALGGAKIGMLGAAGTPQRLAAAWRDLSAGLPLVIDPVLVSSSGAVLLEDGGLASLRDDLFPQATLVTPNWFEAALLLGWDPGGRVEAARAARELLNFGPGAVLVTGGDLGGAQSVDFLACADGTELELRSPRTSAVHSHGTGCLLSASILSALLHGRELVDAVRYGKRCVELGLELGSEGAVWLGALPER